MSKIRANQAAAAWVARLHSDSRTQGDLEAWRGWMDEDARHREAFAAATTAWEASGAVAPLGERRPQARDTTRRGLTIGAAAAAMGVAATAWLSTPRATQRFTTGVGELRRLRLADGSRVILDTQSSLDIALASERREITLWTGRAHFDVAPDVLRPFIVKPAHRQFAVVGTMFDVSYRHDTFSVFPLKGEVAVGQVTPTGGGGASQYLVPGEQFVMVRDKVVLNRGSDLKKLTSWQSGRLIFEGEPLSQAIAEVSLYTTRRINAPQAEVRDIRINGVYNVADPDAFVESVARLVGCDIERHGNDILLIKRSDSGTSINSAGGAYDTRATS